VAVTKGNVSMHGECELFQKKWQVQTATWPLELSIFTCCQLASLPLLPRSTLYPRIDGDITLIVFWRLSCLPLNNQSHAGGSGPLSLRLDECLGLGHVIVRLVLISVLLLATYALS
jgi:hypothetical protein